MNNMSEIAPLISDLAVILIAAGIITLIFKLLETTCRFGVVLSLAFLPGPPYLIYQRYPILPI